MLVMLGLLLFVITNLPIMKLPGQRKSKHYFPVSLGDPLLSNQELINSDSDHAYIVGIDQTLVDIEAKVDDNFIERVINSARATHSLLKRLLLKNFIRELTERNLISHEFAAGTIGNIAGRL
ncbi:Inosine-guanosine kinase [Arsenophonus endosymbiont of Bemisia tabaci Q2]|nr:Inosine-guanosine kinase [Arsenophonus endosymbiont of Bemisia tabaci Q2]